MHTASSNLSRELFLLRTVGQEALRSRLFDFSLFSSNKCGSKDSSRNAREIMACLRKGADWTRDVLTSRLTGMTVSKGRTAARGLEGASLAIIT